MSPSTPISDKVKREFMVVYPAPVSWKNLALDPGGLAKLPPQDQGQLEPETLEVQEEGEEEAA